MSDTPFRIALLGAFGAGASRPPLEARRIRRVDRDSLDQALAATAPALALALPERPEAAHLAPRALDDLHPDRLIEQVDALRELTDARSRMATVPSFERTVARIRAEADVRRPAPRADEGGAETLGLLERIVDAAAYAPAGSEPARGGDAELEALIRRIVDPHVVHEPDARQQAWLDEIDRALQETLRAIVRHPALRALERSWRAVDFLARRLETDGTLQLHLVDVDRDELAADLERHEADPARGAIARQLARVAEGGWSLLVVLHDLGATEADARLATRLAQFGRLQRAAVVAGARPALAGAPTFAGEIDGEGWDGEPVGAWEAMRRDPRARWLGLVAPRFLLRLPYGRHGELCERLAFEEIEDETAAEAHERYLWGSGALCAALLLGEAFATDGWAMRPSHDVPGLPLHVVHAGGEPTLLPCAEGTMYERGAERLLELGIMPLAWMRDTDAVRLVRFQSVAWAPAPLAGRWEETR